jgi:hypothetical protein
MMSSARMAAPEEQRNNFFGALDHIREEAVERGVQACVVLSNEHYTNFFLENFPQLCIGLGEKNWGPTEEWLPIDKVWVPGTPAWPTTSPGTPSTRASTRRSPTSSSSTTGS